MAITGAFFSSSVTFPFIPFMVKSYFPHYSKSELGTRSGFLATSFFAGRAVGGVWWGWSADKFGRYPTLITSLILCSCCSVVFGFSTTYEMALSVRFVWGCCACVLQVMRSMMSELTTRENRSKTWRLNGFGVTMGSILGSVIGGIFSEPADKYSFLNIRFFRKFPFCLPVLVAAGLNILSLTFVAINLPETKPPSLD
eukprot:UN34247